jgi:ribosome-associated protein
MTPAQVAAHLASAGRWGASRSSGPGGQRRDHAETRVEFVVAAEDLGGLPEDLAARLARGLGLDRRALRLRAGTERSRERNRSIVEARLLARVTAAMLPPAPPRRPTRPTRAARERRLADKRRRAGVKDLRRAGGDD